MSTYTAVQSSPKFFQVRWGRLLLIFKYLGLNIPKTFKPFGSTEVVIASIHIHTVQNHRLSKHLNWGYHAHPCLLFKQAKKPLLSHKHLLAPKSGRFAKSSLMLNIQSRREEKADSGKVQDWRQSEPHVKNSFLITGNAVAHCVEMHWFIFTFSKVGLCLTVNDAWQFNESHVLYFLLHFLFHF